MPKSSAKSPSLKQSTLSFGAAKRTASSSSIKKPAAKRASQQPIAVHSDSDDEIDVDDIEISDDDEHDEIEVVDDAEEEKKAPQVVTKPQRTTVVKVTRPRTSPAKPSPKQPLLELDEKDPRWLPYMAILRAKRGHLKLIHAEEQDKFHDILRVFDLSYEYGPCVGVSRLERWERASAFGLNPPIEVHDILTTRQGINDESYAQSVFNGEV